MLSPALKSYKNIIRAAQQTFKNDTRVLNAAIDRIRSEFRKNQKIGGNKDELVELANITANMLRRNVVQAIEKPDTNGVYVVNITKDTELLDNETIRQKRKPELSTNKCCKE